MNLKTLSRAIVVACAMLFSVPLYSQTAPLKEDFTADTTTNIWHAFNGACLTASSSAAPGVIPGCTSILSTYYATVKQNGAWAGDSYLVGGTYGYLGATAAPATPDPVGSGALRFTNGAPQGFYEKGAIVSDATLGTSAGIQVTFKTVTYLGAGGVDGADGISFYLMDGCMPIAGATMPLVCAPNTIYGTGQTFPAIGSSGGSLGYTCSNSNPPYDGLVGAYLGLGIDEYGNFLNGTALTTGETDYNKNSNGTPSGPGDNTASGGYFKPGRIGLRGAGSVSWQALSTAYGTASTTLPYYPAALATTCPGSTTYRAATGNCRSCSSGTYNQAADQCQNICASGYTYNATGNNCLGTCSAGTYDAPSGNCINICTTGTYSSLGGGCGTCSNSGTYNPATNKCSKGTVTIKPATTKPVPTKATTTSGPVVSSTVAQSAVSQVCSTGNLYNYNNYPTQTPTMIGPAAFGASTNPANIMDYTAINNGWSTNVGTIAVESATTRAAATPIMYNLKITQDGFLSLSYAVNGGIAVNVLANQQILNSNGPLPAAFRFGFAGSTGGSTNVHEILCFKAQPVQVGSGTGGVNVYQDPTLKTGSEFFLASYFPGDMTGSVTATGVNFDTAHNILVLAPAPTWDAGCVLTGGACASTGSPAGTTELAASRVMLTWNGAKGIPFEWDSLTSAQQTALTRLDVTPTGTPVVSKNRLLYLRGDTTNEITTGATCPQLTSLLIPCFRARDKILGDIIDSSPTWVGPPDQPYVSLNSWVDAIYTTTVTPPENAGPTYQSYLTSKQGRTNVVYVGANDGFLHGFRAGALDSSGNLVTSATQPNDGYEVLAYMPGAVLNNIHPTMVNSAGATVINSSADYSNTQYGHAYFVDATPATGDLYYGGAWHSWVVGGLGAGGAAFYALDVTDPSAANFVEGNAQTIVIGEWSAANLVCANDTSLPAPCKNYLGNTFGTPEIRRFHNGDWGVIFGNGFGNVDAAGHPGAAGIFIMLVDSTSGAVTFYYLPVTAASATASPNGIGSPTSLDIDLDHIIDFIYAGDLLGNVWKFDVTSTTASNWAKTASSPLFTAPQTPAVPASGGNLAIPAAPSPISTRLTVGTLKTVGTTTNGQGVVLNNSPERVIIQFGTGQAIPQTTSSPTIYSQGPQYIFGIWDWDFGYAPSGASSAPNGTWNKISVNQQAMALAGPQSISLSNMVGQTVTPGTIGTGTNTIGVRTVSKNPVCWKGDAGCSGTDNMGWYIQLPGLQEQVIFDPTLSPDGEFVVNTYIPSNGTPLTCTPPAATGYTMGLDALTGGGSPTAFLNVGGASYDGVQLNGTGSPSFLSSGHSSDSNAEYLLTQTTSGIPAPPTKTNRQAIVAGQRLYWIQRR